MPVILRIRKYHALFVLLVPIAYLSAEEGDIHFWVGYGLLAVLLAWLLSQLFGGRQSRLSRHLPRFGGMTLADALTHRAVSKSLVLGILLSLIGTVGTGVALDQGQTLGIAQSEMVTPALADDGEGDEEGGEREREDGGLLGEIHETLANLLMILIGVHIAYVLVLKRSLAKLMLFWPQGSANAAR
ncbi:MAG: hypothetical protein H6R00_2237 [Proteobacteria bacterium]|nr:hypothetical protein [Pseudomonadota bacterium]